MTITADIGNVVIDIFLNGIVFMVVLVIFFFVAMTFRWMIRQKPKK